MRAWLVSTVAAAAACATPSERTTWLDDELDGVANHRPSRRRRGPASAATEPARPQLPTEPLAAPKAADLEVALLRFTALHRQGWPDAAADRWPGGLTGEWRTLLADLKHGLRSSSVGADRRLMLQIRITLEAELERSVARYGPAPKDVVNDTRSVFGAVQRHLLRPPERRPQRIVTAVDIVWPVTPQILTSPFGYRRDPILGRTNYRFHAGIDLGGRSGTTIVAAAAGEVIDAGWSGGHGRSIKVRHRGQVMTIYAHLKKVLVRPGQRVAQGEVIGLMGSSGRSTGPHLHFEVRRGNVPLDPLELLLTSRHASRDDRAPSKRPPARPEPLSLGEAH